MIKKIIKYISKENSDNIYINILYLLKIEWKNIIAQWFVFIYISDSASLFVLCVSPLITSSNADCAARYNSNSKVSVYSNDLFWFQLMISIVFYVWICMSWYISRIILIFSSFSICISNELQCFFYCLLIDKRSTFIFFSL